MFTYLVPKSKDETIPYSSTLSRNYGRSGTETSENNESYFLDIPLSNIVKITMIRVKMAD